MLVLSTLHNLLTQLLAPPTLHTACILTPAGQLVSYAAGAEQSKDAVRVLAAVSAQVWQTSPPAGEDRGKADRFIENELGRVLIRGIGAEEARGRSMEASRATGGSEPVMLLVLNGTDAVDWEEMEEKAQEVVNHLSPSIMRLKDRIVQAPYWSAAKEKK